MRMRRKRNLDARMQRCADYLISSPVELRGAWRARLPQGKILAIELGCGKGGFTAKMATAHPDTLFVAVERVPDAMVIAMERAAELALRNVLFIDADAARLDDFFAPGEADCIYLNFSDPWPPAKHAKRRLTHPNFLRVYHRVLRAGGELQFKTDNTDLFEWSLHQFPKEGFRPEEISRDLHADGIRGVMTDYEEKFHSQGVKINLCRAVREDRPET